jgi:hypothetical protein
MRSTTAPVAAPPDAPALPRYSAKGVLLGAMIVGIAAVIAGNVVVLGAALAIAPLAVAVTWAMDVLAGRCDGPLWIAWTVAILTGGAALALLAAVLIRVLP